MFNNDNQTANSYYEFSRNSEINSTTLEEDIKVDVVVIGGGLTGCSTALHLAQAGVDVAVVEARHFGWGASGRSGGQIIVGFSAGQGVLEKQVGNERAKELWDHSLKAVEYTRELIKTHDIQCDLTMGYLHVGIKPRQARELQQWAEHLSTNYDYQVLEFHNKKELGVHIGSNRYCGGLSDPGSGHLHPLNYCLGVTNAAQQAGVKLFDNTNVIKIDSDVDGYILHCSKSKIRCNQVVYGCNAYIGDLAPEISSKIMPVGTYIIASEPLKEDVALGLIPNRAAVADSNFVLDYFRLSADNRMLFGGRVSYSTLEPFKLSNSMATRMINVFPQLQGVKTDFSWGGYVAITRNRAPHIGQLKDGNWYAQGYSGHGMALTGYMGKLLSKAVLGDRESIECFEKIPHKTFPGGSALRTPALVAAMAYYKIKDKL